MYNFLLVLRALIANRFCYICDWEGRKLGGGGTSNLTSRIRRRRKCSHCVLFVSEEWWVPNTEASLRRNLCEW